jgi:uncharacterized lipoprotein YddW (UPF0748 family)
MKKKLLFVLLSAFVFTYFNGCAIVRPSGEENKSRSIPRADREFRGVWVATVSNIDWPSKPGLSTDVQKKEAITILDSAAKLHLNAVIFQVRPHCDAMYPSQIEPWSSYLTGTQGKAPDPYYDPLEFWIQEAHNRGIELHAWFNPYRAFMSRGGEPSDSSIVKKRPDLAKKVGNGTFWLDPSKKETQDYSYSVIMDVVKRYDIDGVHFDDYFYPYGDGNFPDDDSWEEYTKSGGSLSREDWRRAAVNSLVERVYKGIKSQKQYVKFGISPFGIWRPTYPPSIGGYDQYNRLYADAKLWLNKGWIDYWTPQLYWPINQIPQSFPVLLGWWSRENTKGRNLWPGMILGRMNDEKSADEIINQIMIERGIVPESPGHVLFSMKGFLRDSSVLVASLKNGPYKTMALVPSSPWLDNDAPAAAKIQTTVSNDTLLVVTWSHDKPDDVFRWVVYYQYDAMWEYTIMNSIDRSTVLPLSRILSEVTRSRRQQVVKDTTQFLRRIAVSAVDRTGNESELTFQDIAPKIPPAMKQ